MTIFNEIQSKNIEEFAEWLDKYGAFDGSPWIKWFDKKYCSECDSLLYVAMKKAERNSFALGANYTIGVSSSQR